MKHVFYAILVLPFAVITLSAQKLSPSGSTTPKITFIELGSVNCSPCKKMQPVMKAIEQQYYG